MAYGTANVDVIQSSTANVPVQFNDGNGTQVGTLCRAWCNYKGTATRGINASFNISSVTYNGTGSYTFNFTNSMPDANYSWNSSVQRLDTGGNSVGCGWGVLNGQAAGSLQIKTSWADNGGLLDFPVVTLSVYR